MDEAEKIRVVDLVKRSVHSRYRYTNTFGGTITFYGRDTESPTGVRNIGACLATAECCQLIASTRSAISPLSPTEGLR